MCYDPALPLASETLTEIVSEVQEINRHVNAIVESAKEQALALKEINTAVNTMDQSTQQNAAMVEETSAASQKLAAEAGSLSDQLAKFRFEGDRRHVQAAGPASTPRPSPAGAMIRKVASAFGGRAAAASAQPADDWQEF